MFSTVLHSRRALIDIFIISQVICSSDEIVIWLASAVISILGLCQGDFPKHRSFSIAGACGRYCAILLLKMKTMILAILYWTWCRRRHR
jgi:hypothetical protein